jgi:hypothetical protein
MDHGVKELGAGEWSKDVPSLFTNQDLKSGERENHMEENVVYLEFRQSSGDTSSTQDYEHLEASLRSPYCEGVLLSWTGTHKFKI